MSPGNQELALKACETWARPRPLPRFGHAYDWPREAVVLWNKLFGPSRRYRKLTPFVPRRQQRAEIATRVRLAFVGDVLPGRGRPYRVGDGVRQFLAAADYLVLNLEGVMSEGPGVVNAVKHQRSIVDFLTDLFPPQRTVLLFANNHAADCGWEAFQRGYEELRAGGFRVVGRRDEPSLVLPEGVQLANGAEWLNVRHWHIASLTEADEAYLADAAYRIFCPHWGTEMTLYPWPSQIARARRFAERWNLIVGHHPHCPQPIAEENGRLIAYSLGNFARGDGGERGWHGAALRVALGPDATGRWQVGESHWTFIAQTLQEDRSLRIDTAETCRFFA